MDGELLNIEMNVVQLETQESKSYLFQEIFQSHTTDSDGQFQAFFFYSPPRVTGRRVTLLSIGVCPISQMNESQNTSKKEKK